MYYCAFIHDGTKAGLKNTIIKTLEILPTFSAEDVLVVLKTRGIEELSLTEDREDFPKSFIQTFPNLRAFGEYFVRSFTSVLSRPNLDEETRNQINTQLGRIYNNACTIQEVVDTYSETVGVFEAYVFNSLEDFINWLF